MGSPSGFITSAFAFIGVLLLGEEGKTVMEFIIGDLFVKVRLSM